MLRSLLAAAVGLGLSLVLVASVPKAACYADPVPVAQDTTDAELVTKVKDAIDKGVRYLKKNQSKGGDWEGLVLGQIAGLKGGVTSLATLALLNAGVPPTDTSVAKALDYLRKLEPDKTYVVALQTMVLAEAHNKADLPRIQKNVEWFKQKAIYRGGKLEGWSYPSNAIADNSNTQYALLGLYAAKTAGVKVEDKLWNEVQDYYTRTQHPDKLNKRAGFWTYHNHGDTSPSFTMTVGGACGLLIANMGLNTSQQQLNDATGIAAKCGEYAENDPLAKGMFWIGLQFNFMEGKSYFYNYYGLERLGRLSGQRFIGDVDWYRNGCKRLVKMQEADGSFLVRAVERKTSIDAGQPIITTSFALLFLSKGRTPVLMSKFAWGNARKVADFGGNRATLTEMTPDGRPARLVNWNRKHNDCRNIVEFASRELFDGVPLSWQAYDPRLLKLSGELKDKKQIDFEVGLLLQSPVLYLNGHGPMPFVGSGTELLSVEEQTLKRYVEEGGFLLGEACCGDREFAKSFEELIGRIFPGSTLRRMPPQHAIWTMFPGVNPADFPDLMYIDRGCRTVAVFSPSPLAGYWEEQRFIPTNPRDPKNRGEKAFCLARNIIAYATGMELPKPKLTRTILVDGKDGGIARSKFRALQLQYTNAEQPPAADALRNLMAYLGANAKLDVALSSEVLPPGDPRLTKYKFMYMHGRKPVQFTQDEADNLKANLQTGGLLLADAACGDFRTWKEFDRSFRESMAKMWGNNKLVPIVPKVGDKEDPLFKIAHEAGIDIKYVKCRRENAEGTGPEKEMRSYPVHLEGIQVDGRWVVIYSKYDVGCAIEGHKSADCLGHDKESALRVGAAIVLYSLKR